MQLASIHLWEHQVGAVFWDTDRKVGLFEYAPEFLRSGLQVAPVMLPLRSGTFAFPDLNAETYLGLPGLLSDSLPDHFGTTLIALWLARQGRSLGDFNSVERLCYIGSRGMGALEFQPSVRSGNKSVSVEVEGLVYLANRALETRNQLDLPLHEESDEALEDIIRVGTSAGGARPKAVVAVNWQQGKFRSGQTLAPEGYEHWLIKFDGVNNSGLGDPLGFGRIEYAYYLMATAAGINMAPCRLLEEHERAHFLTKRFDRIGNDKIHMQSLCAMGHLDFNRPGRHSYENALRIAQGIGLPYESLCQLYRRMLFNVVARNQDDHTRNITFLMNRAGQWSLSPAYDLTWAYNPSGMWTQHHQLSLNGKLDDFSLADLLAPAERFGLKNPESILEEVLDAVSRWPDYAEQASIHHRMVKHIGKTHRLEF
ncbi:MAG: type II toxin-antitoxin system HipA family toxin [Opitutales bacterium]|nr:type II toxin-antitoxin system HipA family toxin [Opitutales bacterium]